MKGNVMPAHCSLSTETTFNGNNPDPGFIMEDSVEGNESGAATFLRLGVRAQLSLVHAMSAVQNSTTDSKGALWWIDEVIHEVTAMRAALQERAVA